MKEAIIIYRLGSLGDTLVALPCFNKVRQAFPTARITLLTNKPVSTKSAPAEAVLGGGHFLNDVIAYTIGTRNPLRLLHLFFQIRKKKVSKLVFLVAARSPESVKRDLLFFRLAGIRTVIGAPSQKDDYSPKLLENGTYENESLRLVNRLRVLGDIDLEDPDYWDLHLTTNEVREGDKWVDRLGLADKTLAVSVGTKIQAKDWGKDNWQELLTRLSKKLPGWKLLLVGSAEESQVSILCGSAWADRVANVCGKTSPRVNAAILSRCAVFVGHDSGPMHLAANAGVPCVAIFAARNLPGHWYPRGSNNRVIYHQTDCFGCGLEICEIERKKCITSITVDEVEAAVLSLTDQATQPVS